MVVVLSSCAHLGLVEVSPPGTDLTTRDVLGDLHFDGHRENFSMKSAADINLSMHFNSLGPLPKYEPR
jgi:hypothetical protein